MFSKKFPFLFSFDLKRKGKCKYSKTCAHYYPESYTCSHRGGSYCGEYNKLSKGGKNNTNQM